MIICVAGPTGIGKTKLSIMLAKKYNGIIVNSDATQIYKELDIGSAKVTEEEKSGVKHYMLDIKNPDEDYSVMEYQLDARKVLEENKDKNIIVIGGTGLYIKALFYNYEFSHKDNNLYEEYTTAELYDLCLKKDKDNTLDKNNRIRLINFLNNDNIGNKKDELLYDVIFIGLTKDRKELYDIIDKRVDIMFENGLLEEVESLYKKYPNSKILKRAIGYKEVISYLNNEISLDECKELIKKNTRHYVKRQYTWYKHQMNINWFNVDSDFDKTYDEIISFIESLNSK